MILRSLASILRSHRIQCLMLFVLFLGGAIATLCANPPSEMTVTQTGTKNRIIFDYTEPEPSSSPTPESTPSQSPTPTPATASTPAPTPEATVAPIPEPTPEPVLKSEPEAIPQPAAEATPEPTPPAIALMPQAPPSTPEPNLAAEATPAPTPDALPTQPVTNEDVVANAAAPDLAPLPGTSSEPAPAPSQSVTVNLINKLVERGILTKSDASAMIHQAEAEAEVARSQSQSDMFAIAQVAAVQAASDQIAVSQAANAPASPDDVRVTYIPEPVKTQIKEEIKLELLSERASTKWATGVLLPNWVGNAKPFADLRLRYEGIFFPQSNDATGAFPNFNAINTGLPFDTTGNQFAPQLNADQDRTRYRIRFRFGSEFNLGENFTSGFRVATGDNNSPVTTNQTLGAAGNAQGGNFSKYAIWLDRAFLRYDGTVSDRTKFTAWAGRFDNPFFSTPLIWDEDLGFDGVALQIKHELFRGFTPFFTAGVFAVFNTDLNFSSNQPAKFKSYDKYLYGVQGGIDWKPAEDWKVKVAVSYYYFENIEGKISTPYTPQTINDAGDTDASRPSFAQKGNTYMALRDIIPDASNDFGAINQWQYYGLATKFQELAVTGRIDYTGFEPVQVSIIGEWVQNLAFNSEDINLIAVNNRGDLEDPLAAGIGIFDGSNSAWLVEMRVGAPALEKRWDWNVNFGYRWVGSDAVVDGFNDSDFGLGGTNVRGFTVGAQLALSKNVYLGIRWMGSESIAGPSFKADIIQLDLNSKF